MSSKCKAENDIQFILYWRRFHDDTYENSIDIQNLINHGYQDFIIENITTIRRISENQISFSVFNNIMIEILKEYENVDVAISVVKSIDMSRYNVFDQALILKHMKRRKRLFKKIKAPLRFSLFYALFEKIDADLWKYVKKYMNNDDTINIIFGSFFSHEISNEDINLVQSMKYDVPLDVYTYVFDQLTSALNEDILDAKPCAHLQKSIDNINMLASIFCPILSKKRRYLHKELIDFIYSPMQVQKFINKYGMEELDTY